MLEESCLQSVECFDASIVPHQTPPCTSQHRAPSKKLYDRLLYIKLDRECGTLTTC